MFSRGIFLFLFFAALAGCGTYRGGGGYQGVGDYHGPGNYRPPSDYAGEPAPGADASSGEIRSHYSGHSKYIPHGPFRLIWPVARVRINRGFHPPSDVKHEGLDLGGRRGTPVMAAHEGLVIYAGHQFHGYGNMVMLEYSNEWATLYAHLDRIAVREGQILEPGDVLGTMGSTGHATGVHLHFEVMHHRDPINPLSLLTKPNRFASAAK